ncbi:NAD(P)-dependent alcohol dehydrogenase [Psychrobacter sp. 16-MNA-CIBAN-0192]|uniref:NAD(P)-dependent alcohol dehydrogenase n=1 Tax=Psychrobacter sp. 16-MNA-CIBAN-0192 TaxID=3140448 RepID=UPI00331B26E3
MNMMKSLIFIEPGKIEIVEKRIPDVGPNDALLKITTTTICGTDIHIYKGEYPVAKGLTIGHEPVGIIEKLGSAVQGYQEGQRVIAGAICPSFSSYACQDGFPSQDGGYKATGGWRFGNIIDGTQAEYVLVPDAQANLAPVPDGLTDEQVLMCPDIMSTGFKGAENANINIGDIVAVFAQGPIGLCATAGARLKGASTIIAIDGNNQRLAMAKKMGADITLNFNEVDVVDEVLKLTGGRGVDSSIEALGLKTTFEQALKVLKPGGTLSSLGVYSEDLTIPMAYFASGLGDHTIRTALCPGGKERMRRLMNVIETGRVDLSEMVTHTYALDDIVEAYDLFMHQRDGVLKIAIKP